MSSTWSSYLTLSIFGQSHGPAVGMTLEGIPAGTPVDMQALAVFLQRRAPGRFPWQTPRQEADEPRILSGLLEGKTTGDPIAGIIENKNTRSGDYEQLKTVPRPGHADFTAQLKYGGNQAVSGGGHFSGRLTAPLCIAGGICLQVLAQRGIFIGAHVAAVAEERDLPFDPVTVCREQFCIEEDFPARDPATAQRMIARIQKAHEERDSVGGVIECAVVGLPGGLGGPIFDGMENRIARLAFGVPAVKGIEFGAGFGAALLPGSVHNDPFYESGEQLKTRTNHHGGILGGITSGMPLLFRVAVKPTPSIGRPQESVNLQTGQAETLTITGRHDPCIVPRAVPCMEAVAALAICDAMLEAGMIIQGNDIAKKEGVQHEH